MLHRNSTPIVSSFPSLLLKAWNEWDVRGMVLLSLFLQIILSVLGNHRKYTNNLFIRTVLWFAYLSADWVAIASLGKLSGSPTTNILRAFWAPLLILHLGGPDTITAYAYEDNNLWTRHLLILVVKVVLAIYVIFLSWTPSWLSFLTLPLIIAGIAKYVERILCLQQNISQKTESIISTINFFQLYDQNSSLETFLTENANVFLAYVFFSVMRPDVNNYLSHNLLTAKNRIQTYFKETMDANTDIFCDGIDNFLSKRYWMINEYEFSSAELGFMFDVVYTKAALIYSKTGCILRLTSVTCCFSVLLLFLISIIFNKSEFHFSRVDIYTTGILLGGAIALELYAAWVMLSSDWAIIVAAFHRNMLVRKMFWFFLNSFRCLLYRKKRWSNQIGQFDLLNYCLRYKKKEANQLSSFRRMITCDSDLMEMWRKYRCTVFVTVPGNLKKDEDDPYTELFLSFFSRPLPPNTFEASRGKIAPEQPWYDPLKWSIELDFDHSIIVWHLATTVCYYHDAQDHKGGAMKSCKNLSDYMMYLLAMYPAWILPDQSKSFWLDHTYDKVKELIFDATDTKEASIFLLRPPNNDHEGQPSSNSSLESLQQDVRKLAGFLLNQTELDRWETIKKVWIEMLLYAATSSSHISHVKQLGEGGEFLSLLWLGCGISYMQVALERALALV